MGCGQSSHFEGEGQTLGGGGGGTSSNNKSKVSKKSYNTMNSTTPSSSNNRRTEPIPGELERRAAMLNAAEERAKKGANRGVGDGKLAAALAALPSDGGRRTDALEAGKGKDSAPLVWD